jgi:polyisoprenoid-binding protein YceI
MKKYLIILLVFIVNEATCQKYITKTGKTEFKASVATFEPVEAINKSTTAILNIETGEVASLLFIKAFQFEIALMQEHFNENYMDSDQYPKATFKGKIQNWDTKHIQSETKFKLDGILNIKGIEKSITTDIYIKSMKQKIGITSSFVLNPEDFNIEIPGVVREKIAEEVTVYLNYELEQKK